MPAASTQLISLELRDFSKMDRVKNFMKPPQAYKPLSDDASEDDTESQPGSEVTEGQEDAPPFSWVEYTIFVLLGVAMLWAW